MTQSCKPQLRFRGFTLIELILVMALLAIIMAFAAPSLARSLRQRGVDQEASRFLALLEYARSEAVSQGVPMIVWLTPADGRYGVEAKTGFAGDTTRARTYTVTPGVTVSAEQGLMAKGVLQAVEFAPDGWPVVGGAEAVQFADANGSTLTVAHTTDRWGYELRRE